MYHFCTLFDSHYLSRGVAMFRSLAKFQSNFHLYIFPFDETSYDILVSMALPNVTVIGLSEFENEQLLAIKGSRSKGEYCWTCTPSIIYYCIEHFQMAHCTYVDADVFFLSDPAVLIDEMGSNSILITEHRYTPTYDLSATSGIYCVQFITFRTNELGLTALNWWKEKCIEWCYARKEDGKFGDQKYLDDWTSRFPGVHVLQHLGGGVAPWNVQQYTLKNEGNKLMVRLDQTLQPVVFYHFHDIKFYKNDKIDLGSYKLADEVMARVYYPYLKEILEIEADLMKRFHFARQIQRYFYKNELMTVVHRIGRRLLGIYNVTSLSNRSLWPI